MAEPDPNKDESSARRRLIELFEADEWKFTKTALHDGKAALAGTLPAPIGDCAIADYILDKLRSTFPLARTLLGEPPGTGGVGWVMNNPDGHHTYIKLKIEEDGIRQVALVMSCHTSKHAVE